MGDSAVRFTDTRTSISFGMTYNVNSGFAVEGEGNFFPRQYLVTEAEAVDNSSGTIWHQGW